MKKLSDYTDKEKIEKLNQVYSACLEEVNSKAENPDTDEHYFWKGIIEDVLDMKQKDWDIHNDGGKLGVIQIQIVCQGRTYYLTKEEYKDVEELTNTTELISEAEAIQLVLQRLGKLKLDYSLNV